MSRDQARRFRPTVDHLEPKVVLSGSGASPMVSAAIVPTVLTRATYNQVFTKIQQAFLAYEGPYDNTINTIGQFASGLVSMVLSPNSANDPNANSSGNHDSFVASSKGDGGALSSRLKVAIDRLPGGPLQANSLIHRTFALGGLTPTDAEYFRARLDSMVRHYVDEGIKTGEIVMAPRTSHP